MRRAGHALYRIKDGGRMNRLGFKIVLFVVLWYEIAAEFRMGADPALLLAVVVFFGWRILFAMAGEFLGISHPLTAGLLVRGVAWLILFLWLAPPVLLAQPMALHAIVLTLLAAAGARCRHLFEQQPEKFGKAWLREHSEWVSNGLEPLTSVLPHGGMLPEAAGGDR
jgi:hypothetical protein